VREAESREGGAGVLGKTFTSRLRLVRPIFYNNNSGKLCRSIMEQVVAVASLVRDGEETNVHKKDFIGCVCRKASSIRHAAAMEQAADIDLFANKRST